MDRQDSSKRQPAADPAGNTFPRTPAYQDLAADERASAARALEALRQHLDPTQLASVDAATVYRLLGYVVAFTDRVALDLRRGWRAGDIDTAVGELDRYVAALLHPHPDPDPEPNRQHVADLGPADHESGGSKSGEAA